MKIDAVRIYQYSLELNQPILIHDQQLQNREGLVIHLKSEQGTEGFGEIAPLPGFSRETLSDAREQVQSLKTKLTGRPVPPGLTKFDGQFEDWLGPLDLKPSVRFGVESALLHLLANVSMKKAALYKLIPDARLRPVRVSGLLSGAKTEIVEQAKALVGRGFTEFKLKVGGVVDEDIGRVRAVNDVIFGKALLHCDANQSWDFDEAVTFAKAIGVAAVSYIEEPFQDVSGIPEFFDQTLIPVALDESLQRLTLDEIRAISGVETIILKPTIFGGIEKTLQIMAQAENFALDAVISSSFESSLGIWMLANIFTASSHNTPAGLDTLKWFKTDVLKQPVDIQNGAINITHQEVRSKDINFDLLKEL